MVCDCIYSLTSSFNQMLRFINIGAENCFVKHLKVLTVLRQLQKCNGLHKLSFYPFFNFNINGTATSHKSTVFGPYVHKRADPRIFLQCKSCLRKYLFTDCDFRIGQDVHFSTDLV